MASHFWVWMIIIVWGFLCDCSLSSQPHKYRVAQNCISKITWNAGVYQILAFFICKIPIIFPLCNKDFFIPPAQFHILHQMPLSGRKSQKGISIWNMLILHERRGWEQKLQKDYSLEASVHYSILTHIHATAWSRLDEKEEGAKIYRNNQGRAFSLQPQESRQHHHGKRLIRKMKLASLAQMWKCPRAGITREVKGIRILVPVKQSFSLHSSLRSTGKGDKDYAFGIPGMKTRKTAPLTRSPRASTPSGPSQCKDLSLFPFISQNKSYT